MSDIIRRGKFFGLFCSKPDWVYVYHNDWATDGVTFYRWCKECDRLERVGFIYSGNSLKVTLDKLKLPPYNQMIPYVSGPEEVDLIHLRTVAGFRKD